MNTFFFFDNALGRRAFHHADYFAQRLFAADSFAFLGHEFGDGLRQDFSEMSLIALR